MKKIFAVIVLLSCNIVGYCGHITKFSNSSTIFRSGEAYTVCFIDNTKDFFGKPLVNMKYTWNFGDSIISNDINPIHRYTKLGKYNISLTVIDTISNFTSDYFKQITISNFKDTCTTKILDTINVVSYDTIVNYIIDTTHITIVDTIYIVSTKDYELLKCNNILVYTIDGKYITVINDSNFGILPKGIYIIKCNNITTKIIKL